MISDDAVRQESNDTESIDDIHGDERVEDLTHVGQLLPCLDRIARLQSTPVEQLDLQEAAAVLDRPSLSWRQVKKGLSTITRRLGSPKPEWVRRPDPANMPLLAWSSNQGFGVLRGQNALGQWIIEAFEAKSQTWQEQACDSLQGFQFTKLTLAKVFRSSESPVYELIRTEVFSNKKLLFEVILAGFVINIVALATSFYTMLVYDRVVPTGALNTLWVLTIRVGISVIYELITKVLRHRLYNRLIEVVDQRLARPLCNFSLFDWIRCPPA